MKDCIQDNGLVTNAKVSEFYITPTEISIMGIGKITILLAKAELHFRTVMFMRVNGVIILLMERAFLNQSKEIKLKVSGKMVSSMAMVLKLSQMELNLRGNM